VAGGELVWAHWVEGRCAKVSWVGSHEDWNRFPAGIRWVDGKVEVVVVVVQVLVIQGCHGRPADTPAPFSITSSERNPIYRTHFIAFDLFERRYCLGKGR